MTAHPSPANASSDLIEECLAIVDKHLNGHAGLQYRAACENIGREISALRIRAQPAASPANDALMGKSLAEAHRLLQESGYNFEEAHPECYRNFSYAKLFQLIEADRIRAQQTTEPIPQDAITVAQTAAVIIDRLTKECAELRAQQMGEPATYQWRFQYGNGEWSKWQNVTSPWDGKRNPDWEYRQLYAAFTSPTQQRPGLMEGAGSTPAILALTRPKCGDGK